MVSIEKSKDGKFYSRITGANNEKLVKSETLSTKHAVFKNNLAAFKELAKLFGLNFYMPDKPKEVWKQNIADNTKKKKKAK